MLLSNERHTLGLSLTRGRMSYLIDGEYGGGMLPTMIVDSDHEYRYLGGRLEVRRELWAPDPLFVQRRWHYLGLRLGYRSFTREIFNRDVVNQDDIKVSFDRAVQHDRRRELILTYTLKLPVTERFWLEGFAGLGAVLRTVHYREVINLRRTNLFEDLIVTMILPGLTLIDDSPAEGTRLLPALRLGFRATYLLSPAR